MKAPIIVDEHGAATIFESVKDAERYLEAVDVENNEYIAYDSEGRLLRLIPTTPRITIRGAEQSPTHSPELRTLLTNLLGYTGVPASSLREATLQELVEKALEFKVI